MQSVLLSMCPSFSGTFLRLIPHKTLTSSTCAASTFQVPFTADRYNVRRRDYATITEDDLRVFRDIVGESGLVTGQEDLEAYNVDWLKICRGTYRN